MVTITMDEVKKLRDLTNVSIMQCKKALEEAEGDMDKAQIILKEKSSAAADKKSDRAIGASCTAAYIHQGGKVGSMVQLGCETDFVSQNPDFVQLANDLAMHIGGMNPEFLNVEDITAEVKEREDAENNFENYKNTGVLMNQTFLMNPDYTVAQMVSQAVQKFGENVTIVKFARFS
jgi:elongation factor Ts